MTRPRQSVRIRTNHGEASSHFHDRAFTILELMIITVVIFVALGILVPALSHSADRATRPANQTQRLIAP